VEDFDWTGVPPDRRPEVRRRIEILERFLSLPNPTKHDRKKARDDLGVSRPMFYLLLKAWLGSQKPGDLPGARAWKAGPNPASTINFPEPQPLGDLDWSSVPQSRRAEVRRRIEIIDGYLRLANPTAEDRTRAMAQVGVRLTMFQNLVSAWRRTRDPAQFPGARGPTRSRTGRRLPREVEALIQETVADLGAAAEEREVIDEVRRRCLAAGLPVPSKVTIQQRQRRAQMAPDSGDHERAP
jgi:hypothetical protein